jgi:D-3-phosphoglycerate dehydrogenase
MFKVLISDPLSEHGIQKLLDAPDVEVVVKTGLSEDELVEIIGDFDAMLVRSQTKVTDKIMASGKKLKAIGRAGVGVDNIDLEAATRYGIVVINAPDGNTISTAEYTFAMMMAMARKIPQAHKSVQQGEWNRKAFVGIELRGKTLGIIGFGRIGSEVAKRAKAFEMNVLAYDPFLTEERASKMGVTMGSVNDICKNADIITVHTPLIKETHHMIGSKQFELMKPGVRILNCARGGIIDEKALLEAIQTGKVAGAALDVYEEEPPHNNPLLERPEVVTCPHLGASTIEAQENVAIDVSEELLHLLHDEPFKNAVNLPRISSDTLQVIQPYYPLAEKLGQFVSQMSAGGLKQITVTYSGELSEVDTSSLTRTVLKGILFYYLSDEVNYINAPNIAQQRGIDVVEQKTSQNKGFTNLITVTISNAQREEQSVAGTLLNGYGARIVKVNQYPIDIEPEGHLILIHHNDMPGVIGRVGTVLGNHDINIATMQVGRKNIGGQAIMMLSIDKQASENVLAALGEINVINSVTEIDL